MTEKYYRNEEHKMYENVLENIRQIRKDIGDKNVILLAVTKTVPVEIINAAITEGGIRYIGENRVQELLSKYDRLAMKEDLHIHLIGSLQTNKVKYIIDKVELIQSVDSLRLIDEIQKQAAKIGKVQDILIEINIGREESKGGIFAEQLPDLLEHLANCPNVRWKGLMCIPPFTANDAELQQYFLSMQKLLVDNVNKKLDNRDSYILSMGMSRDYNIAIASGSDMIRVGSAIFGKRK